MGENERAKTYIIPENFIEGGRIVNGMFRTRNFIEALLLGGAFAGIAMLFPIEDLSTRISFVLGFSLPWFFVAVVGVNDDPLSVFVKCAFSWLRNKRIMYYNNSPQARTARPLDMMMSEELPRDKLISIYEKWAESRREVTAARLENATVEFEEDNELKRLRTPKQQAEAKLSRAARRSKLDLQTVADQDIDDLEDAEMELYEAGDTFSVHTFGNVQFDERDLF